MTENFDNGRVRTILVIDDEPGVLGVVDAILREDGYEVVSATSVGQAIETATSLAGRIALFIVDHPLSMMPGRNLVEAIARAQPGIKVLWFSGDSEDHLRATGQMKAESSFLQKPFTTQLFKRRCETSSGHLQASLRVVAARFRGSVVRFSYQREGNLPILQRTQCGPAMDEVFAFVCSHCGESVTVQPPKPQ